MKRHRIAALTLPTALLCLAAALPLQACGLGFQTEYDGNYIGQLTFIPDGMTAQSFRVNLTMKATSLPGTNPVTLTISNVTTTLPAFFGSQMGSGFATLPETLPAVSGTSGDGIQLSFPNGSSVETDPVDQNPLTVTSLETISNSPTLPGMTQTWVSGSANGASFAAAVGATNTLAEPSWTFSKSAN